MSGEDIPHDEKFMYKSGCESIRVLHVDDNSKFLELTVAFLDEIADEITVVTETTISGGSNRLDPDLIDCVVCDYEVPPQNGIDFLRRVREMYPDMPFILFTGKGSEEVASEAISAGVTDYLQKAPGREQFELLVNRIRNAVEQNRTDQTLRDLQSRYKRAAHASADAFADWKIQSDSLWWSDGLGRIFGYTSEEPQYDFTWWKDRIHPDDSQRVKNSLQEAITNQEELVEIEHRFQRADDTYAQIICRGFITYENGKPVRATGALIDVTDRKKREQTLEHLHQTSRDLTQAETPEDICSVVANAAQEILDLSAIGLYLWDESEGVLRPQASTPDTDELLGDLPTFTPGSSLAWDVFIEGETQLFEDIHDHENRYNPETVIQSELMVPLGEYGVFISGATSPDAFTDSDLQLAEMLAANTTAALQRAEREQDLREKEQELREQNKMLHRLHRVNSIIRTVQRDVVQGTTRAAVEQAICDNLVQVDHYQFAWIGIRDESGQLTPRAWAGMNDGYLDELLGSKDQSDDMVPLPATQALDTEETVSIQQFRTQIDEQPWLKDALDRGYQSLIAIPFVYKESNYGMVEIHADQPTLFSEDEQEVLREVCDLVANAFNAIERRQAIVVESDTELKFHIEDVDDVLFRLARQAECTLELNSLHPRSGGEWLLYVTVSEGELDALLEVANQLVSVDRVTPLEGGDDKLEIAVSNFEITTVLGEYGATLHSIQARPDGGSIVVHLPQSADVSSFIGACKSVFSSADLVRRKPIASNTNGHGVTNVAIDLLTDRQRDVLEMAYRNGFFEWPREHTGEEIANRLDVSPPTFHRHIRTGTNKLLADLFE